MSFSQKQIEVSCALANGQFAGGGNTASFSSLRTAAQIEVAGGLSSATASVQVYGLPLSVAQQLATVGPEWNARYKNGIQILAGDDESGMSLVFSGVIFNAYVDGSDQPNVNLNILAQPGAYDAVAVTPPTSIKGSADVAGMIGKLVKQTSLKGFVNNGVNVKLQSPYYSGSAWSQIYDIAEHANIDIAINAGTLTITPRGKPAGSSPTLISPATGLVGYPAFVQNAVVVQCEFNPAIQVLGTIEVLSSLGPACGTWYVKKLSHDLESVTPGGKWFTTAYTVAVNTK